MANKGRKTGKSDETLCFRPKLRQTKNTSAGIDLSCFFFTEMFLIELPTLFLKADQEANVNRSVQPPFPKRCSARSFLSAHLCYAPPEDRLSSVNRNPRSGDSLQLLPFRRKLGSYNRLDRPLFDVFPLSASRSFRSFFRQSLQIDFDFQGMKDSGPRGRNGLATYEGVSTILRFFPIFARSGCSDCCGILVVGLWEGAMCDCDGLTLQSVSILIC